MPETKLNTEKERPLLSCFDMTSDALVELPRRDSTAYMPDGNNRQRQAKINAVYARQRA